MTDSQEIVKNICNTLNTIDDECIRSIKLCYTDDEITRIKGSIKTYFLLKEEVSKAEINIDFG